MIISSDILKFRSYLENEANSLRYTISILDNQIEDLKNIPRNQRRKILSIVKKAEQEKKEALVQIENLKLIIKCIDNLDYLKTDFNYQTLVGYLFMYLRLEEKEKSTDKTKISNEMLNFFIFQSKGKTSTCKFLTIFDNEFKLNISKFNDYKKFIYTACKETAYIRSTDEIDNIFISEKMIEEEKEYKRKKEEKIDEFEKIKKITEANMKKENNFHNTFDNSLDANTEKPLYADYVDESTFQLKNNIIDLVSLNELIEILKAIPNISKKKIEEYKESYNNKIIEREITLLLNSLNENDRKLLREIISHSSDKSTIELYRSIKESILSFEYMNSSIEDKCYIVSNLLNDEIDYEKPNQIVNTNILIFPYETFFEDEVNSIINNGASGNKERLKDSLNQQFTYLRTQNLNQMASNGSKAFHEVKEIRNTGRKGQSLVLDGKLKVYRYGAKKVKVCIVKLSVSERNQIMLKEKYNCEFKPHILLSFALGNVSIENENDFYIRVNKNSQVLINEIRHISELFKKDFNKETFEEACKYIDSSINQMQPSNTDEMHI